MKTVDHKGKEYESVEDMIKSYGITRKAYEYRKRKGWSLQKRLETPMQGDIRSVMYNGKKFASVSEMCKTHGIPYMTYMWRIKKGWSREKAIETPVKDKSKPRTDHFGKAYRSLQEMVDHYGINRRVFTERVRTGWSLEEALTTPVTARNDKSHLHRKKKYEDPDGRKYASIKEMAEAHGVPVESLYYRLKVGYTLEEALKPEKMKRGPKQRTTGP